MSKPRQDGMLVPCSEKWENMVPTGNGRHCSQCARTVIDFTQWDRDVMRAYFQEHPKSCGMFRAEQVDPTLIPLVDTLGPVRHGLLAAALALGIHTANAQTATSDPIELDVNVCYDTVDQFGDTALNGDKTSTKEDDAAMVTPGPTRKHARYGVYASSRFQFVHVRDRTRGKYITKGCPTF